MSGENKEVKGNRISAAIQGLFSGITNASLNHLSSYIISSIGTFMAASLRACSWARLSVVYLHFHSLSFAAFLDFWEVCSSGKYDFHL